MTRAREKKKTKREMETQRQTETHFIPLFLHNAHNSPNETHFAISLSRNRSSSCHVTRCLHKKHLDCLFCMMRAIHNKFLHAHALAQVAPSQVRVPLFLLSFVSLRLCLSPLPFISLSLPTQTQTACFYTVVHMSPQL